MKSHLPNNQSSSIAQLNDHLRTTFDQKVGMLILTSGVNSLKEDDPIEFKCLIDALRNFDDFEEEENDPYFERDFGAITLNETKFFFKIDYYDRDSDMTMGSERPWCNKSTFRVLTLMLASEY